MAPEYRKLALPDIFKQLYNKKKAILIISVSVSVITAIITLFIPNQYKSMANLLPAQHHNLALGLLGESGLGSLAGSFLQPGVTQTDKFYVLLNSHTVKEDVVKKFHLEKVYKTIHSKYPLIDAIKKLDKNTKFEDHDEGNFVIDVWDTNPKRAKAMADYYVKLLNKMNTQISIKEAKDYLLFIQKRYLKATHNLDSLVQANAEFEKKYGIFDLPAQVENYLGLISDLTTKKIETQVKLDIIKKSLHQGSNIYQKTQNELDAINQKLESFHTQSDTSALMVSLNRLPAIGQKYFYLQFGLTVHKKIMEFILPLYEQAKMEEAKAIPVVSIVDAPFVPKKKNRPRRSIIVILAFFSSFILSDLFFVGQYAYQQNKEYFDYIRNKKVD